MQVRGRLARLPRLFTCYVSGVVVVFGRRKKVGLRLPRRHPPHPWTSLSPRCAAHSSIFVWHKLSTLSFSPARLAKSCLGYEGLGAIWPLRPIHRFSLLICRKSCRANVGPAFLILRARYQWR